MPLRLLLCAAIVGLLSACTTTTVTPVDSSVDVSVVCIENNPEVVVEDFVPVLMAGLKRNGINARLVEKSDLSNSGCTNILKYTARRTWDLKPYLRTANLQLFSESGELLASADYKVANGLNLGKYAGTAAKIDPLIDEVFGAQNET